MTLLALWAHSVLQGSGKLPNATTQTALQQGLSYEGWRRECPPYCASHPPQSRRILEPALPDCGPPAAATCPPQALAHMTCPAGRTAHEHACARALVNIHLAGMHSWARAVRHAQHRGRSRQAIGSMYVLQNNLHVNRRLRGWATAPPKSVPFNFLRHFTHMTYTRSSKLLISIICQSAPIGTIPTRSRACGQHALMRSTASKAH